MRVNSEIQRIENISRAEFEAKFVVPEVPVIITGALERWPARQSWTAQGLRDRIGPLATRFKFSSGHRHPDFSAKAPAEMFAVREGTFAELIDALTGPAETARRHLLTGEEEWLFERRAGQPDRKSEKLQSLLSDYELPPLFDQQRLYSVRFWMSAAGVRTWLHYDNNGCHNLNAQVQGEKEALLFSPAQLGKTYPFPLGCAIPAHSCSQVDVEQPDLERFADFEGVECSAGTVKAGDLLFIPANWLHSFLHVGSFNCNVDFWWKPGMLSHNPVSARQALLDAVAAIGGVQGLSREQQHTLREVEAQLLRPDLSEVTKGHGPSPRGRLAESGETGLTALRASRTLQRVTDSKSWLVDFIQRNDGVAGTVHLRDGEVLTLEAAHNIPPKVQEITRTIPKGKGMAGLAWERAEPVQTCNLKTDTTGDVRPGAKAVDAKGAVAIPVSNDSGQLLAVVGIAYNDERELDSDALAALCSDAEGGRTILEIGQK